MPEYKVGQSLGDMHCVTLHYLKENSGNRTHGPDLSGFHIFSVTEEIDWGYIDWEALVLAKCGRQGNKELYILEVRDDGHLVCGYHYDRPTRGGMCILAPR